MYVGYFEVKQECNKLECPCCYNSKKKPGTKHSTVYYFHYAKATESQWKRLDKILTKADLYGYREYNTALYFLFAGNKDKGTLKFETTCEDNREKFGIKKVRDLFEDSTITKQELIEDSKTKHIYMISKNDLENAKNLKVA